MMITKLNIILNNNIEKIITLNYNIDSKKLLKWKGEIFFHHLDIMDNSINTIINDNRFIIVKCNKIIINKKIINLKSIYNIDNTNIVFYKNKNILKIIKVLSKTADEMISTGLDQNGDYIMPLIVNLNNNNSCFINY